MGKKGSSGNSKAASPAVTRDLRRIRALTPYVRWPDLDAGTRARLAKLTGAARARLDAGDLPGALAALAGANGDA